MKYRVYMTIEYETAFVVDAGTHSDACAMAYEQAEHEFPSDDRDMKITSVEVAE
jgi:hypothetical protein